MKYWIEINKLTPKTGKHDTETLNSLTKTHKNVFFRSESINASQESNIICLKTQYNGL